MAPFECRLATGLELDASEIEDLVAGVCTGRVSDAQIAAFTMATWFRGMNPREQMALTIAMRDSGAVLRWPGLDGPVLDKHSTGGVGDLVSLVLGPVVAACGGYVPMISGHGLGHTGGTLDKLESIPGFDTALSTRRLQEVVRECGVAIVGQTGELVPADRRFYAVRDVTATVASTPLIVSSILSKKLAEGLDALVLDIKYGCGAFMAGIEEARKLAVEISGAACAAGLPCNALVTNMDQPLASCAGNALEVREAVRVLRSEGNNARLLDVVLDLSAELLRLGGLAADAGAGRTAAEAALRSGRAAERFARMVQGQGGPAGLIDDPQAHLPRAPLSREVLAGATGFVTAIDTRATGMIVVGLGGGRHRAEDTVDPSVGLSGLADLGQKIEQGQPIGVVHAASEADWEQAANALRRAYRIGDEPPVTNPAVACLIEGESPDEPA